jgi:hypothetical protein
MIKYTLLWLLRIGCARLLSIGSQLIDLPGQPPSTRPQHLYPYRSDVSEKIADPARDHFGHRDIADALVAALAKAPRQFTIGLFGPWGTGKSTILTEVGRQVDAAPDHETAFAVFDAWRYDGDSLRREFIRSIGADLKAKEAAPGWDEEAETKAFDVEISSPRTEKQKLSWKTLGSPIGAALTALIVIGAGYAAASLLDLSKETILSAEIAILGSLTAFILAATSRSLAPMEIRETKRRVEFPDQFAVSFGALLGKVNAKRLVIGIDNLDRCSPARVAEILSTVKTFLEPKVGAGGTGKVKSMCFVIAADDEALRRHLSSQEAATREAIDEYLRKFFNASIRITDALMEDMKAFTAREIEDFVASHPEMGDGADDRLVEMAAQALKHNPRRMKQFINNLELRLQLLAQRRGSERIQIEPDVLMVAKLAILEEEFPTYYAQLRANPRMLSSWQEEVARAEPPANLEQALVAFLRFTAEIKSDDIRPYLFLKQSNDERNLPGHAELVGVLEDGSSEALRRLLEEDNRAQQDRYVEAAGHYFEEQVHERSWNRAGNALRALTEIEALHGQSVVDRALDVAVDHQPDLETRLPNLDPAILLAAARASDDEERFSKVLRVLLRAVAPERGAERREPLFSALATFPGHLRAVDTERIATTLAGENVRSDFESFEKLAKARPELLNKAVVRTALDQLKTHPELIQRDSSAFQVATAALSHSGANVDLRNRFVDLIREQLSTMRANEGVKLGELHPPLTPLLEADPSSPSAKQLAQDIVDSWEESESQSRWIEVHVALRLCRSSEEIDEQNGKTLGDRVLDLDGPRQVAEWAGTHYEQMPKNFKAGFRQRLAAMLSGAEKPDPEKAQQIADALPERAGKVLYGEACKLAVQASRLKWAERCLPKASKQASREAMSLGLQQLTERAATGLNQEGLLDFLLSNQEKFDSNSRFLLAERLVGEILKNQQLAQRRAPALARLRIGDSKQRTKVVEQLLGGLQSITAPRWRVTAMEAAITLAGESGPARGLVDNSLESFRKSGRPMERAFVEAIDSKHSSSEQG